MSGDGPPGSAEDGHSPVGAAASASGLGPMLQVTDLAKRYDGQVVFQGVNLEAGPGEFIAILGESGVGKSTLLNCLAGLDHWDQGRINYRGTDLGAMDDEARARWRRTHLGFVFQAFHVLAHLNVDQNIGLPLLLLGRPDPARVTEVLDAVGLEGLGTRLPQQLSGGQLQRVAIARALVHQPSLILADEPTGNLDPATAERVMDVLLRQIRAQGCTLILVTHSIQAARRADRVLRLEHDGIRAA